MTACFYTSVHLSEALFYNLRPLGEKHSNWIPLWFRKKRGGGAHGWRHYLVEKLVRSGKLPPDFLIICKDFHNQSNIARYLIKIRGVSYTYFNHKDIHDFINVDLPILEREVNRYLPHVVLPKEKLYGILDLVKNIVDYYLGLLRIWIKNL